MPHPPADWDTYLKKFLSAYQIGVEQRTTRKGIAEQVGIPEGAVGNIQIMLKRIGAMDMRFGPDVNSKFGKATFTKVHFTHEEIMAEMKRQGLDFTNTTVTKLRKPKRGVDVSYVPRSPTAAIDMKLGPTPLHTTPPKDEGNPFEVLRPMLKDEPKALIEAARAYRDRTAFLQEKVEEFERHGLKLDPAAIGVPSDPRMDIIALILPYVDALERANESMSKRMADGPKRVTVASDEDRKLRGQIAELQREKSRAAEAADKAIRDLKNRHADEIRRMEREFDEKFRVAAIKAKAE